MVMGVGRCLWTWLPAGLFASMTQPSCKSAGVLLYNVLMRINTQYRSLDLGFNSIGGSFPSRVFGLPTLS